MSSDFALDVLIGIAGGTVITAVILFVAWWLS